MDFARIVEIIVTGMGLLYLWWEYRADARMWILGIIMPAIDIYLYWNKGVYGNMAMSSYYLLAAVYGLLMWRMDLGKLFGIKGSDHEEAVKAKKDRPITNITPTYCAIFGLAVAVVWAATYYWLVTCTNSTVPVLDALTNALSIVGMWALARKFLQQWVFWIVYDMLTVYLDAIKDLPFKAGIHAVYVIVAIFGYLRWRKMMKEAR